MSNSSGGRGSQPVFSVSRYRGTPPEVADIVQASLSRPMEGEATDKGATEYVSSAENPDSFEVRSGDRKVRVFSFEPHLDKLLVQYEDPTGQKANAEIPRDALDEVFQQRQRALTQLESFLQEQIEQGSANEEKKGKLEEILSSVSQYQHNLMSGIDRQLGLSEKVFGES